MAPSEQLPPNPNLRQLRNQAKDLHKAQKAGDPDALRRIGESHPRFSGSSEADIAAAETVLADAQLVIARELGFSSWPKLKAHVQSLSSPALSAQAVVIGNNEEARVAAEIEKLGGWCKIDSSGRLQTVSLKGRRFTDAVTEHLKGLTSLKELYLVKTQVGDEGLEHLKGLTALERLYLFKTQVSDAGLEHLKGLTNLERLYLGGTQVTDAGLEHLKELTGLRRLDLRFVQVTDGGVNQLGRALPDCKIYR
jgi:hypothetical protein